MTENENKERLGVTDPVELRHPTAEEIQLSGTLTAAIDAHSPLECEEGLKHREQVLRDLQKIILEWIYEVGVGSGGYDDHTAREAGGKIFTFGSYRLGVVGPNSDIDALCVAPRHVSRESFFQMLAAKLQEHPKIADFQPVPDAYTPIMKMKFDDVDIDLLFARLNLSSVKDLESLEDDNLLKNLDDKSVRCMNGCRVNDAILRLVPNRETFKEALRVIKYWAKRRGLYSNVMGFFGGITWAILVARICQLYPNACTSLVVGRFFRIFEKWNWKNAVLLRKADTMEHANTPGLSQLKVWSPRTDRHQIMPVVTPAFPSMNSTHNVSMTTKRIILAEMKRAWELVEKMEKDNNSAGVSWDQVFADPEFFSTHRHYIQVQVLAKSDTIFHKWFGWIESKIRFLFKSLESFCDVRPWPYAIDYDDRDDWAFSKCLYVGLKFSKKSGQSFDLRQPVVQFVEMINGWTSKEEYEGHCEMKITHLKKEDLPSCVNPQGLASPELEKKDSMMSKKRERPSVPTMDNTAEPVPQTATTTGTVKKKIKVSLKK